jgi:hypothetical protein
MGELEEDRAREEGVAKVTPELGEGCRHEDGPVAFPDVCVGMAGVAMCEPAKLLVQGAQDTVWMPTE